METEVDFTFKGKAVDKYPESIRAALAAKFCEDRRMEKEDVLKLFNIGISSLQRAIRAKREFPDLFQKILNGDITVSSAWKQMSNSERQTPTERNKKYWEGVIDGKMEEFLDVSKALYEIRERGLYQDEYGTFKQYLKDRWGIQFAKRFQVYAGIDAPILAAIEEREER